MRIIDGKYEILTEVGKGGSSVVYLARDIRLNKNWAVKEIRKTAVVNGVNTENQLLAEAELMKNLDHPALPRIVDIIDEGDRFYIVMDYVEGETLSSVLKQFGPQKQGDVIAWGIEILSIFRYLHTRKPPIIYRDMKPKNIILQPNGALKLIDFGIARTYKENKAEDTMPMGTKGYAAPEQWRSSDGTQGQTDARTDIYNLGMTMYELLTGLNVSKPPYEAVPIRQIRKDVSAGLEKVIEKSIRQNPDDRFQSAEEMYTALLNYEKYDEAYVKKQKEIIKKAFIPFMIGLSILVSSFLLFGINAVLDASEYDQLIMPTGNKQQDIKNLSAAIMIKPAEVEGYILLADKLADDSGGITESDSETLLAVYNNAIKSVDKDSEEFFDINAALGEAYLAHFTGKTDQSIRNRVISAMPFFRAAADYGRAEYADYDFVKACVNLGDFYTEYVLSDTLFDATKNEYLKLIETIKENIGNAENYRGKDNNVQLILVEIMLNILDSDKDNIAAYISRNDFHNMVVEIKSSLESMNMNGAATTGKKDELISKSEELLRSLDVSYKLKERNRK